MTEILVPLGKHLFSADALNKIAADAIGKIPPDKTSAIVGGVDADGAKVALVLTKHGERADVKFVTALEHDWAGGNSLGVSGVFAFCLALLLALPASAQPILVGVPDGLTQTNASITFKPEDGAATIPLRGWYNVTIFTRTNFANGTVEDCKAWLPFHSELDPDAPETAPPENKIMLATECQIESPQLRHINLFNNHLAEFRTQLPLYNQFTTAGELVAFGYNYQCCLPEGIYEVRVNPNLHMGIPGTLLPGTILDGTPPGRPIGSGNIDFIDPVVLAAVPPKMGNPPGDVTLAINWIETIPSGFIDQWGLLEPEGFSFEAWLNFNVHLNPVPEPTGPTFTLHDNPWGVLTVAQDACPSIDFQGHHREDAGPLAHTHINPTACVYAETPRGQAMTIPFTLKLWKTAGAITIVKAQFMGPNGTVDIPVQMADAPIVTPPPVVTPPPPPPPVPQPTPNPPPPPQPLPTTFVLPLTVTICDASVPPQCIVKP